MGAYFNCTLDIIGLTLVLIIFIYGRLNGKDHHEQAIFDALLVSNIGLMITDGLTWCMDGNPNQAVGFIFYICQFLCYNCAAIIVMLWALYCDWRLYGEKRKKRNIFYWIYWALFPIAMIVNIFHPIFFYMDEANVYHRCTLYSIYVIYNGLLLLHTLVMILRTAPKKNPVERKDAYSLLLFCIPPLIGVLIQFSFYGISVMPVSLGISLLLIFVHRLSALITIDNLTGLNNRRAFERNMQMRIGSADDKEFLYLIVMDANDFKEINDLYGHKIGDEALIRISMALKRSCKPGDILARLGGDEFVILGRRKTKDEIEEACSHVREQLERENASGDYAYTLSLSLGYSVYEKHTAASEFFQLADDAMYEEKQKRKKLLGKTR